MKRKIALCLTAALLAAPSVWADKTLEFTMGANQYRELEQTVEVKELDAAPYTKNDRTMVPVRVIAEAFGAQVGWEESNQTVTIQKGNTAIALVIGQDVATVNGEQRQLDAPAELNGERTMVPLRFCAEVLGNDVAYVDHLERVLITDRPAVLTVDGETLSADEFELYYSMYSYMIPVGPDGTPTEETEQMRAELKQSLVNFFHEMLVYNRAARNMQPGLMIENVEFGNLMRQVAADYEQAGFLGGVAAGLYQKMELANAYVTHVSQTVAPDYTDDQVRQMYRDSYVTAKHILIPTMDLATSQPLSGEGKAEALKTAQLVADKLKKGEDFDQLMHQYSKDTGLDANPDGYTFTKGQMVLPFETAAFALEENQVSDIVESEFGYHIIKRLPLAQLDEAGLAQKKADFTDAFVQQYLTDLLNASTLEVNQQALDGIE